VTEFSTCLKCCGRRWRKKR